MVSESSGGFEQFLECNRIFNFSSLFDLTMRHFYMHKEFNPTT